MRETVYRLSPHERMDYHPEIFEPYQRLIEITIAGERKLDPENNTILRCLQFLDIERISNADLCWNGDCADCRVWVESEGREKAVISCRTRAAEGMNITRLSETLSG